MPKVVKRKARGAGAAPLPKGAAKAALAVCTVVAVVAWIAASRAGRPRPQADLVALGADETSALRQEEATKDERQGTEGEAGEAAGKMPALPDANPANETEGRVVPAERNGYYRMPDGKEFRFKLPPEGKTASLKVNGILYRFDSEGRFTDISKPKIFDNPIEKQLSGIVSESGSVAPGFLLRHSDDDIMAALLKPVEISPDDSDDVKAKKEALAEFKQEILAYIEQGGTYEEYVTEMAALAKQERKMKREGIKKIVSMLEEGNAEEAREFYATFNKLLQEEGYLPLKLQKELQEKLGIAEESRW